MRLRRGGLPSWPGAPLRWIGHLDYVNSVAYSPDGRHIVSGSDDKTLRIWDAETGAGVGEPLVGQTNTVYSVAYSPEDYTSSRDPKTAPFESGMPKLVPHSVSLWRGTPTQFIPLLILPMDDTSSRDPLTAPFESGMPRLVPQSAGLWWGTLGQFIPLLALPMDGTLSRDPMTTPFESGMPRLVPQSESPWRGSLFRCLLS